MQTREGDQVSIALKMGAAVVVVAGLLAVAGCGGDDDETTASSSSTEESTEAATTGGGGGGGGGGESVSVSLKDYSIDPADPKVEAGTVSFDVSNDGQVTHTLEVEGPGEEAELEPELAPGDSGTLEVDLSKPGTYEWYCPIGNHRELGMEGEITVG
jgi:uncharacterized cupredoxin-like copper-binding protein